MDRFIFFFARSRAGNGVSLRRQREPRRRGKRGKTGKLGNTRPTACPTRLCKQDGRPLRPDNTQGPRSCAALAPPRRRVAAAASRVPGRASAARALRQTGAAATVRDHYADCDFYLFSRYINHFLSLHLATTPIAFLHEQVCMDPKKKIWLHMCSCRLSMGDP